MTHTINRPRIETSGDFLSKTRKKHYRFPFILVSLFVFLGYPLGAAAQQNMSWGTGKGDADKRQMYGEERPVTLKIKKRKSLQMNDPKRQSTFEEMWMRNNTKAIKAPRNASPRQ